MKETIRRKPHSGRALAALTALALVLCLLPAFSTAENAQTPQGWVDFLLICNEGMNNDKGNAGNTLMVVSMNTMEGKIRLLMFTWDTFVDYEGYDVPQKLDMPYRNNGPEEAMKVFNHNFGTNIEYFISLNYLNLAELIDDYGGVNVDISRAERNALNGMVASKKEQLLTKVDAGFLTQALVDALAKEYYLTDFGPDTHLNGLQAVGFGWLQYDSVYNCCERDAEVVAGLFHSASTFINDKIALYTDATGVPSDTYGRRAINLDNLTDDDYNFIHQLIAPIFQMSENNMTEEEIRTITLALARIAYRGQREGADILDYMKSTILPLEATKPYDIVAGTKGHLVDKEANREAVKKFLYSED